MLTAWLSLLRCTRVTADLVSHRLTMPRRFRGSSLDELLAELGGRGRSRSRLPLARVEREVRRVERILSLAPRLPDTCLYRALARYATLSREGFPAVFMMGLPRAGGKAPGHAWVEVFGEPFAESATVADLAVTFRYPPEDAATP